MYRPRDGRFFSLSLSLDYDLDFNPVARSDGSASSSPPVLMVSRAAVFFFFIKVASRLEERSKRPPSPAILIDTMSAGINIAPNQS